MTPSIQTKAAQTLIGMSVEMSLANNKTSQIWKRFRSRVHQVPHRASTHFISLQVYPKNYFKAFDPALLFVKWACVAVTDASQIPSEMETLLLPGGLYAVFHHKGTGVAIFQYIYSQWIPNSEYVLDNRPHFEVLGPQYKPNDPQAEEEIWIPIRKK